MQNVLVFNGLRIHTVPKVASTSISAAMASPAIRRAYPDEPGNEWRFMVVRHPLDRLVSAWRYFTTDAKRMQVFRHDVEMGMAFPDFLDVVLKNPHKDRHTAHQWRYKGRYDMDQTVRLENLSRGWERLVGRFPVLPMPHKNATEHGHWRDYFDAGREKAALAEYEADLRLYEHAS